MKQVDFSPKFSVSVVQPENRYSLRQNFCIQSQWMFTCQTMKLDRHITLHTNFNSKGIDDFIDKPINTNLLEEKTGRNPSAPLPPRSTGSAGGSWGTSPGSACLADPSRETADRHHGPSSACVSFLSPRAVQSPSVCVPTQASIPLRTIIVV